MCGCCGLFDECGVLLCDLVYFVYCVVDLFDFGVLFVGCVVDFVEDFVYVLY